MSSSEEKKPGAEPPISFVHRNQRKDEAHRHAEPSESKNAEVPRELDVDSGGDGLSEEAHCRDDSTLARLKAAGEDISSIYSLHIPKDVEKMLWFMSFCFFFAIFIAYIYFMDRVSSWILIPLLMIPVVFWLIVTFFAYWTETRAYYLIKRTLNYDVIQTLRGYRQYVIRRKER